MKTTHQGEPKPDTHRSESTEYNQARAVDGRQRSESRLGYDRGRETPVSGRDTEARSNAGRLNITHDTVNFFERSDGVLITQ
jgi:hypothetical protein